MAEKFTGCMLDELIIRDLKIEAAKQKIFIKDLQKNILIEWLRNHQDGNPVFTLDQFQDQKMLAIPNLMRKGDEIAEYLNNCPDHIVKEITDQINNVWIDKLDKLFQYGDAKMKVV